MFKQSRKGTNLLDLDDALLVLILEHADSLTDILRFGATSKRLHRLRYRVSRLKSSVEGDVDEVRLLHFVRSLVLERGCLRDLDLSVTSLDNSETLDWIEPVSNTLQSLSLEFWNTQSSRVEKIGDAIPRCSHLVKLLLSCEDLPVPISPEQLEQVVESCPRLRSLTVFIEGGKVMLRSSSLQEIDLGNELCVTLDTPALTDLCVYTQSLRILSHSLKKLEISVDVKHFKARISPPLAELERLIVHGDIYLPTMGKVLADISCGCIDSLKICTVPAPRKASTELGICLEPLSRLRKLHITRWFVQVLARSEIHEEGEALTRLGVEQIVVEVDAHRDTDVGKMMCMLWSFLSSSSLQRLVIDCEDLEYGLEHGSRSDPSAGYRKALKILVKSLVDEFPGVVSLRNSKSII